MTASPLAQTPNDMFNAPIAEADPEIAEILDAELSRQQNGLEMIASENFVPRAVLQAQGSVLTNKYAEGYPGRRYYGGCEQVDKIETIARERAKSLFGAEYANVQPHSGAQANAAVYQALVKPGDTVLGLALDHGGHLTHGMKINFSGRFYHAEAYGVNPETFRIDPEIIRQRALETHPAMIIGGWSAYPRIEDFKAMKEIADEVGAKFWVDMAHFAGLIAAGGAGRDEAEALHGLVVVVRDLHAQPEAVLLVDVAAVVRAVCQRFDGEALDVDRLGLVRGLRCGRAAARFALAALGAAAAGHRARKRRGQRDGGHAHHYLLHYGFHHVHHSLSRLAAKAASSPAATATSGFETPGPDCHRAGPDRQ